MLTTAGDQVPVIPLLDTLGKTGGVVPSQNGGIELNEGTNMGSVNTTPVNTWFMVPFSSNTKLVYKPLLNPVMVSWPAAVATMVTGPRTAPSWVYVTWYEALGVSPLNVMVPSEPPQVAGLVLFSRSGGGAAFAMAYLWHNSISTATKQVVRVFIIPGLAFLPTPHDQQHMNGGWCGKIAYTPKDSSIITVRSSKGNPGTLFFLALPGAFYVQYRPGNGVLLLLAVLFQFGPHVFHYIRIVRVKGQVVQFKRIVRHII